MLKRFLAALAVAALALMVAPSTAGAAVSGYTNSGLDNRVVNSGYSNSPILVCGSPSGCDTVYPNQMSRSTGYYMPFSNGPIWNPQQSAVAPGASALYRLVGIDGWASPWQGIKGGSAGAWIPVGNMFKFFGCTPGYDPCEIQVIHTR